ncbi:hypothetical protein TorRG33x02_356680, partial [Trema orientale]
MDSVDSYVRFVSLLMFMIKVSEDSGIEQSNRVARFLLSIFSLIAASQSTEQSIILTQVSLQRRIFRYLK